MKDTCTVHFLDPKGNRSEIWPIGDEGVPTDVHEKFKDDKGDVYAIVVYPRAWQILSAVRSSR